MGTRIKTYDSTGTAPNGRIYAGDLNAIMDQYADLTNLSQAISVGSLVIGESGLQLLRYGAGEARLSGALRTDGIIRALGGSIDGAFTTTQRNALTLPAYGLKILNTTTNQYEWNAGTPSVPVWISLGGDPPGVVAMYAAATAPVGWLLCQGQVISRTTYANLFSAIGTQYGAGDGSTTFGIPDLQGRIPVGLGTHVDVNALAKNDGSALAARRPRHNHTVGANGVNTPGTGAPGGTGGGFSPTVLTVGPQTGLEPTDSPSYVVVNFIIKT